MAFLRRFCALYCPNICSKSPPGLSGSSQKSAFGFLLGFSWVCGSLWRISRGFAVKGVTLYPRKPASPLRCSPSVSRWPASCSGFPKHSTAFRLHSLPAPLPVLHLPGLHGMPLQLHTMPILAVFGFSWVLLRLGAQTARPAVCGRCLMPLKVAAACIMHHLAFSAHCPAVSLSRILSRKPPASSLSALLGKLPGI